MTQPNKQFDFYEDQNTKPLTASFQEFDFTRTMERMIFSNDTISGVSGGNIEVSFNSGVSIHWTSLPGESVSWDRRRRNKVYLRGELGGEDYRFSAWLEI